MVQVDARVLPAPSLKYAREFGAPSQGSWNLKQLRFQESARIISYGLASFASERIYGSPGPEGYKVSLSSQSRLSFMHLIRTSSILNAGQCPAGIIGL